jgi:hypothetical protein
MFNQEFILAIYVSFTGNNDNKMKVNVTLSTHALFIQHISTKPTEGYPI